MTYQEALRYLESFIDYEKITDWPYEESLGLGRMRNFLSSINNPQDGLSCLHVAGTKGKGSTCIFIAHILSQAGYNVGLYTSPHLADFRERIRILNGKSGSSQTHKGKNDFAGMVSKNGLTGLVKRLKPAIDRFGEHSKFGSLTFFEVYTALAFVYFKEKKADFVVLETGLGGRLDATNVAKPLICAITPISYEHTQRLGNTLRKIATEKAGIIKDILAGKSLRRRPIVISAPQKNEAQRVIRQRCKKLKVNLYEVGKDITFKATGSGFDVNGIFGRYPDLKIGLLGRHQLINAAVAAGAVEALKFHGVTVGTEAIKNGLARTVWPGRCEIAGRDPWVVLDGAQNAASALALKQTIKENFSRRDKFRQGRKYRRLILVFGISKDKDIKGTSLQLIDFTDTVILTKSGNPRARQPEALIKYFSGKPVYITQSVKEARELAKRLASQDDLILVTGSLFVVGEFRDGKTKLL